MSTSPTRIEPLSDLSSGGGPSLTIPGAVLSFVTLVALMHPNPLVLMLLSILFVLASLVMAGFALMRAHRAHQKASTHMALPALIYFFGCAAAMLGDPDAAVQTLSSPR